MANSEHLAKLKEGVGEWNEWRRGKPEVVPQLSGAELGGLNLDGANLTAADLSRAVLEGSRLCGSLLRKSVLIGANLGDAVVRNANLRSANLQGCSLNDADLCSADLRMADLSDTDLWDADLTWAKLEGTVFNGAIFAGTILGSNDLSEAKGLDTVIHQRPSIVGIETIYRSEGRIPLSFLRGAGVPENLIEYMPSLVVPGAIQFYSCFISYSTKDQEFADRLYADLQNKGVRCWFAPHDVRGGKKLHEQIDEAIRRYERLLLILSANSMASEWVKTEIIRGRGRPRHIAGARGGDAGAVSRPVGGV